MTAEGEFPKVDGDILYASEVNEMHTKVFDVVHQYINSSLTSGTDYIIYGGSLFYNPGEIMTNFMQIQIPTSFITSTGDPISNRLRISGADVNFTTSPKTQTLTHSYDMSINHILTSGALTASGGDVNNPFVIFLEIKANDTYGYSISDFTAVGC